MASRKKQSRVRVICESCDGSGVYSGMCEPEGVAVVCLSCEGYGYVWETIFPGVLRRKRGIEQIRFSHGRLLPHCGPTGESVAYSDWYKAHKIPPIR